MYGNVHIAENVMAPRENGCLIKSIYNQVWSDGPWHDTLFVHRYRWHIWMRPLYCTLWYCWECAGELSIPLTPHDYHTAIPSPHPATIQILRLTVDPCISHLCQVVTLCLHPAFYVNAVKCMIVYHIICFFILCINTYSTQPLNMRSRQLKATFLL